jgi:hypothetical protein
MLCQENTNEEHMSNDEAVQNLAAIYNTGEINVFPPGGSCSHIAHTDGKNYIRGQTEHDGLLNVNYDLHVGGVINNGGITPASRINVCPLGGSCTHIAHPDGNNYISGRTIVDGELNLNGNLNLNGVLRIGAWRLYQEGDSLVAQRDGGAKTNFYADGNVCRQDHGCLN